MRKVFHLIFQTRTKGAHGKSERKKKTNGKENERIEKERKRRKTYFDLSMIGFCFWPLAYASKMNSCGRPPVVMVAIETE